MKIINRYSKFATVGLILSLFCGVGFARTTVDPQLPEAKTQATILYSQMAASADELCQQKKKGGIH